MQTRVFAVVSLILIGVCSLGGWFFRSPWLGFWMGLACVAGVLIALGDDE